PDLNPIEHIWAHLDNMVRSRPILPQNADQLWDALQEEWYKIPPNYISKLYDSMPDRVAAVKAAGGGHTNY
ncbi:hypothetical protein BDV93DRAFT_412549, partial [Ceratobasidium sp. AG-I]